MSATCRLQLEPGQLTAWLWRRGQLEACGSFPETPAGFADFSRFLAVDRQRRHLLLVNREEETYHTEKLPRLPRRELRQLLAARSRRLFPDTPWRCAVPGPHDSKGTHSASLMALHDNEALRHWLTCIEQASASLAGLYSLPQLLPALLHRHRHRASQALVISQHQQATRITLLEGRRVAASRLYRLPLEPVGEEFCRDFLALGSRDSSGRPLPSLYLLGADTWIADHPLRAFATCLTTSDDSARALLALPDRHWPQHQFSAAAARQARQLRWLHRATAAVALTALALSVGQWSAIIPTQQAIERERGRLSTAEAALEKLHREDGASAPSAAQLATVAGQLLRRRDAFADALGHLASALEALPEIRLEGIEWQAPAEPSGTPTLAVIGHGIDDEVATRLRKRLNEPGPQATGNGSPPPAEFLFKQAGAEQR